MQRILRSLDLLFALLVALGGAVTWVGYERLLGATVPSLGEPVRVDIAPGEGFGSVARRLEAEGLVPDARALTLWARLTGADREIKHGPYSFEGGMRPIDLLDKMRRGESLLLKVTIPEGLTARQIAELFAAKGLGSEQELRELAQDPSFARSLGIPASSLEGYLYPETYFVSPLATSKEIVAMLVARFEAVWTDEMATAAAAAGFDRHEVVTLASIIEKETGRGDERPLISSVFRNRLNINMPLQSDPTVIYGIPNFDGNITKKHLRTPSPYNTYTMRGLPAGPIANAGVDSLRAVLEPAESDFLYFVSRGDGSHKFSKNLREHERAVDEYQRRRRRS